MSDTAELARRIDAAAAGVAGVSDVYAAQVWGAGSVRRAFDAFAPLSTVRRKAGLCEVTVSIGVSSDADATALRVSEAVRAVAGETGDEVRVTVRVSRIAAP